MPMQNGVCMSRHRHDRNGDARTTATASAKGGHKTLPNGGTVYNNSGSSGGDAGTAEEDNVISNSKGYTLYEWD